MTDAYTKLRLITNLKVAGDAKSMTSDGMGVRGPGEGRSSGATPVMRSYSFPLITYDSLLYIGDVLYSTVSGKYSQELGRLDSARYGITDTVTTGISGTLYFDDISWATNEASVAVPMAILKTRVNTNEVWTRPWTSTVVEGSTGALSLLWEDASAISSPTAACYLNMEDNSSTNFPTGSNTSSVNMQTTKPLASLVGNNTYIVVFSATIDGKTVKRKHRIKVVKPGEE